MLAKGRSDAALERQAHEGRLRAIDEVIGHHEAEHGAITHKEMDAAGQAVKARSIVIRDGVVSRPVGSRLVI